MKLTKHLKKSVAVLAIIAGGYAAAEGLPNQQAGSANVFNGTTQDAAVGTNAQQNVTPPTGPGDPPSGLPINDYLPALFAGAVILAAAAARKKAQQA